MIDAKNYLSGKVLETIGEESVLDNYVAFAVQRALKNPDGALEGLIGILQEKDAPIIMTPQIIAIQDKFCTEIMGKISQGLSGVEGITDCLKSLKAISDTLFIVFINEIIIQYALELDYLNLDRRKDPKDDEYTSTVHTGKTPNGKRKKEMTSTSFGKKRSQAAALRIALEKRETLVGQILERREQKERKKPSLKIARGLVKKGVLEEYGDKKFRIKGMRIRSSKAESTTYDLYYENDVANVKNSRSLNKHTFHEAYNELIEHISQKVEFTPAELEELKKYNNRFLYTQKTSRK